jgi:hypothetical protein
MKRKTLSIFVTILATAMLATAACTQQTEHEAPADTTATEPAPAEPAPAPEAPAPATEPAPAPATSSTAPMDSGMSFADMDKNKDGGVSKDELADTEMLHEHFSAADKDGNGSLSQAEVDGHRAEMAAKPGG